MVGFFGKLPSHGDYVSRRLPRSFIDSWDLWLRNALGQTRLKLGDRWESVYAASPAWRFALGPGVCSSRCWAGLLLASLDRVGRRYPLTLVFSAQGEPELFALAAAANPWLAQGEILARNLIGGQCDLTGFDEQLLTLNLPQRFGDNVGTAVDFWSDSVLLPGCENTSSKRSAPSSLWWRAETGLRAEGHCLCAGLPSPAVFQTLLEGHKQS